MAPAAAPKCFLAIDLGAESGRGMLAAVADGHVRMIEVHRFPNQPVKLLDTLHWDFPRLFHEVKVTIARAAKRVRDAGGTLDGIGVDAWGVDYGLLDQSGDLLGNPVHYRDARTDGVMERVFDKVPAGKIFEETGLLPMQLNTLFQLAAERERDPRRLERASRLLFIADLVHYFLTGVACSERTIVSTSQMWNVGKAAWCLPVLDALGIPRSILPEVRPPGSVVGALRRDIASEAGLEVAPPVIAGACHDTAAAVAAVPAADGADGDGGTWAYLSSGTWSLMGVELGEPLVSEAALEANFTNEDGVGGTVRFLRIIMGLWLVQESRRTWEQGGHALGYDALMALAEEAQPLRSLVVPDDPVFFRSGDMPMRIQEFCGRTGQPVPQDAGAITRCALESLALAYAECAERMTELIGNRITRLHVVGGGSRNDLLDQFAADALGVEVVAGPAEATALGNALMQAVATGTIESVRELRQVVRRSVRTVTFRPREKVAEAWRRATERFTELRSESFAR